MPNYSRSSEASLPAGSADLATIYSAQDLLDVAAVDAALVDQVALEAQYPIHQFKNSSGGFNDVLIAWTGRVSYNNPVTLQAYDVVSAEWTTLTEELSPPIDTDFSLVAEITDLTNFLDAGVLTCRVYQEAL